MGTYGLVSTSSRPGPGPASLGTHELSWFTGGSWLTRCESVSEIRKDQHPRDLSSVVSEEETTDRGDYTKEDGFDTTVRAIDAD